MGMGNDYSGLNQYNSLNNSGYQDRYQTNYPTTSVNPYAQTPPQTLAEQQRLAGLEAGKFGMNMDTAKFGISTLSALGSLYTGLQGVKQAKEQFNFQKDFANANMANQIKAYNTALTDRATSRAVQEGTTTPAQTAAYIAANQQVR